jgi:hypothetical protein
MCSISCESIVFLALIIKSYCIYVNLESSAKYPATELIFLNF